VLAGLWEWAGALRASANMDTKRMIFSAGGFFLELLTISKDAK
jgi:hypothetical protein